VEAKLSNIEDFVLIEKAYGVRIHLISQRFSQYLIKVKLDGNLKPLEQIPFKNGDYFGSFQKRGKFANLK